jgi:HK97 gp10 family phage protein
MSMDAEVTGAAVFATSLASAVASLADLRDAGTAAGAVIVKGAGARTPRRTGRLAASARIATDAQTLTVSWGAPYAAYVNFGTRYMRARPFATDALEDAEAQVAAIYTTAVDQALATVHS